MRHRVQNKKLNTDKDHRKSLLRNLATSFIEHDKIVTTLTKAKFVKPYIEKAVTKAKRGTHFTNIQRVTALLSTDKAGRKLFSEIAPKYMERKGGYTRITKIGTRVGDNSTMARLEWVDEKPKKAVKGKSAKKEVKKDE